MGLRRQNIIKHITGVFLSCLVLSVAIIPKIATKQCHCRDTKTSPAEKQQCPFGQLRVLSSALGFSEISLVLLTPETQWGDVEFSYAQPVAITRLDSAAAARAPPLV